jgi:hypothetical protein
MAGQLGSGCLHRRLYILPVVEMAVTGRERDESEVSGRDSDGAAK